MKKQQNAKPIATKFGISAAKQQLKKDYPRENTTTEDLVDLLEKENLKAYHKKVQKSTTQVTVVFSLEELKVAIEEILHDRKNDGAPMWCMDCLDYKAVFFEKNLAFLIINIY